jgi:hypothetical protein
MKNPTRNVSEEKFKNDPVHNKPYSYFGDPNAFPDNLGNPYNYQYQDASQGLTYFNAPSANSTMVSDSVIMTERLKKFVPESSVMRGRTPEEDLMTREMKDEEDNVGKNYTSKFQ